MTREICEFCNISVKDKYTLKTHLVKNKTCLNLRGLSLDTKFICTGCNHVFPNNINLLVHIESCKKYIIIKIREECKEEYKEQLITQQQQFDKDIIEYKKQLNEKDSIITIQQQQFDKTINNKQTEFERQLKDKDNIILLQQKNADKALVDAHQQIETLQKMLENLASKAIDKPTTTNNTTINQIRNSFSDKYFIEDLLESDIKRKCQSVLTEQVLLEGQRGIARMCTEYFINTKDQKKLLIATDPSRNKFKYMDKHGNMKDDIEARTFIEKVSKPIKEVAGYIFDGVLSDIKDEQENIEEDNYSRKAYLHDKEMQANHSLVYIKCFDDPKHNSEFTNELAILNKNK